MDLIQRLNTPDYITGFAESRIGGRKENQDSYGSSETPFGFVITVCDGMGGGPGGKTASSIAVNEIINGIKEGNHDDTASNILIKAIRRANMAIIDSGSQNPALKGMGSTCTVLLINENEAVVAHVGDSRIYQIRGKSKIFRTFDHSMVFDLVKQKVITEEQARLSAQSNVITRALGIKHDIEVDVAILPYEAGDRFLLSTDGIHGSLIEKELIELVADKKHALGTITDEIATVVDGKGRNEGGEHDNLTLAIIETKISSKLKSKMSKNTKILLGVISFFCICSLVLNGLLLGHNANMDQKVFNEQKSLVDSLTNLLIQKDSVVNKLQLQADSDNQNSISNTELQKQLKALEKTKQTLQSQLKKAGEENKELRKEIDNLKKKK